MPGTVLGVEAGAVKHTDEPHPSRPGHASWGAEQWNKPVGSRGDWISDKAPQTGWPKTNGI